MTFLTTEDVDDNVILVPPAQGVKQFSYSNAAKIL